MATNGLRYHDRLDGASNYVIWKARMSCLMDEHFLMIYIDRVVVEPANLDPLKKYKGEMVKAKRMILDGVKDHEVCHISGKGTSKEMWNAFSMLYHGFSEQQKMYLEQKMRST